MGGTKAQAGSLVFIGADRGQHHDRRAFGPGILLELMQYFPIISYCHLNVQ